MNRSMCQVIPFLIAACALGAGGAAADDRPSDEMANRDLAAALESAHNKHDARAFAAIFVLDGDFTSVRGMTARGRTAIEEFHRPMFEGDTSKGNPSFKNAILKVDDVKVRFLRPDVASVDMH